MRVTNQSISFQVIDGLQRAFQRVAQTQEAVTTGRRINHLSDDPLAAARVFSLRSASASLDQYEKNINAALPALEQGDSALSDLGDLLARAKELALSMANDSNSPEQRLITVKEVRNLFEQVLAVANTKVDNRYIFAGFINGAPPFSEGAGAVAYGGDSGQIQVHTSASGSLATNIPGNQIFQGAGVANGVDIFDVFLKLDSALQNNDLDGPNGIRSQLGRIDSAVDQVLSFRAEFGARTNSAESAKDAIGMLKVKSTEQRSQLEDADVTRGLFRSRPLSASISGGAPVCVTADSTEPARFSALTNFYVDFEPPTRREPDHWRRHYCDCDRLERQSNPPGDLRAARSQGVARRDLPRGAGREPGRGQRSRKRTSTGRYLSTDATTKTGGQE